MYYRVEDVDTTPLVTIAPEATLRTALEAMFSNGTPQVGIAANDNETDPDGNGGNGDGESDSDGELAGIVTHRSITRAQLLLAQSDLASGLLDRTVTLAMEDPEPLIDDSEDVFTLFDLLAESPYVLIDRGDEYHVLRDVGFHQYLRRELEVFILIEEIERAVREIVRDVFETDLSTHLADTFEDKEIRTPSSVRDCSFAHYQVFISANWDRFADRFDEDRPFVRELLDNTGDIRNTLFHFRTAEQQKIEERDYLRFVREYFAGEARP